MSKWISFGVVVILLISGYLFVSPENTKQEDKRVEPKKSKSVSKNVKKEDIEIVYLDDEKSKKNITPKKEKQEKKEEKDRTYKSKNDKKETFNEEVSYEQQNTQIIAKKPSKIKEFVVRNGLEKVSQKSNKNPKYTIYAKNTLNDIDTSKYQNTPPMMPTIISKKVSKNETYTVVVDSKIVQNNDTIYIAKNDDNKEPTDLIKVPIKPENIDTTTQTQDSEDTATDNENSDQKDEGVKLIMPPSFQ